MKKVKSYNAILKDNKFVLEVVLEDGSEDSLNLNWTAFASIFTRKDAQTVYDNYPWR